VFCAIQNTIPACDRHPATQPASHVAVEYSTTLYATRRAGKLRPQAIMLINMQHQLSASRRGAMVRGPPHREGSAAYNIHEYAAVAGRPAAASVGFCRRAYSFVQLRPKSTTGSTFLLEYSGTFVGGYDSSPLKKFRFSFLCELIIGFLSVYA